MVDYPANIIWYVEAISSDGLYKSFGSAVAICLKKNGDSGDGKKYLLTCAHVVRRVRDGNACYGPPLENLSVWQPSSSDQKCLVARVASEIGSLDPLGSSDRGITCWWNETAKCSIVRFKLDQANPRWSLVTLTGSSRNGFCPLR